MHPLSTAEVRWLTRFNELLRQIQDLLVKQEARIDAELAQRVADSTDPLDDYEVDVEITYFLREDDPDYSEDDDNVLTVQRFVTLTGDRADEIDWAEDGRDFGVQSHCWLFHDLYDHQPGLEVRDVLRIGSIWIDIKPELQYFFDTPPVDFNLTRSTSADRFGDGAIATFTGKLIRPLTPIPRQDDFVLEDIVQGLANLCKFHGQTNTFYSIAQHSLLVASLVSDSMKLAALLYDAHAAYVGELVSTLDWKLREYCGVNRKLRAAIGRRFGVPTDHFEHEQLKLARLRVLATERRDFFPTFYHWLDELDGIEPLEQPIVAILPDQAKLQFLAEIQQRISTVNMENWTGGGNPIGRE